MATLRARALWGCRRWLPRDSRPQSWLGPCVTAAVKNSVFESASEKAANLVFEQEARLKVLGCAAASSAPSYGALRLQRSARASVHAVSLLPSCHSLAPERSSTGGAGRGQSPPAGSEASVGREDAAANQGSESGAQLLLPERCKNLLVANWRAQVTTLNANASAGGKDKVISSLARISLQDGSPVIWFSSQDAHIVNLMLDERGSVLIGGTDPPALVGALRRASKAPARTMLMGDILATESSEMEYFRKLLEAQTSSLHKAASAAGLTPRDVGVDAKSTATGEARATGRPITEFASPSSPLPAASPLDAAWVPYRMSCRTCQYITVQGDRVQVPFKDVAAAAADPLALMSTSLLDAINRTDTHRRALVLFCAAYMGVELGKEGAYMIALDRWGFNVLASCAGGDASHPSWREFRFSFQAEVSSIQSFLHALGSMEAEAVGLADASEAAQNHGG